MKASRSLVTLARGSALLCFALQLWFLPACQSKSTNTSDPAPRVLQQSTAPSGEQAAHKSSFLWRVATPTGVAHLLGSVHIAEGSVYPLAPVIERAFNNCSALVVEVDLGGANKDLAAEKIAKAGTYPPGETLAAHVAAPVYSALGRYLESQGMPSMDGLRPWFIGMALTITELERQGFKLSLGIDEHFRARVGDRPVIGLESIDEQVAVFSDLGPTEQEQLLTQTLTDLPTVAQTMRDALVHWKRGEADELNRLLVEPVRKDHPAVYQKLLAARNLRMTAKIVELLRKPQERYFIVVGAAHLVGPDSILRLLEQQGYAPVQL